MRTSSAYSSLAPQVPQLWPVRPQLQPAAGCRHHQVCAVVERVWQWVARDGEVIMLVVSS